MAWIAGYFRCGIISLNLCKEYLNMTIFKVSILLLIKSWTFWYIERLPMSSYTGVTYCQKWSGFFFAHPVYSVYTLPVFDLSEKSRGGRALKARESPKAPSGERYGEGCPPPYRGKGLGRRLCTLPRKFLIVHCSAFLYTNSKVLFAIKCRESYVITRYSQRFTVIHNTSSCHQSRKLVPIQSVSIATRKYFTASHVL